jgi:hypothetical protein
MGKFGKSLWKGIKYTGLVFGAAGATSVAQPEVVTVAIVGALTGVGVPSLIAGLAGQYAVPALVSVLTSFAHQVVKHRDEVFPPKE